MPPDNSLARAIGELIALPFILLRDLLRLLLWMFRLGQRWRSLSLQDRNRVRATGGAGALVACIVLAAHGFPVVGPKLTAGIGALALLYLIVGIVLTFRADRLTFDVMAVFWRCALVIGGVVLLAYAKANGL